MQRRSIILVLADGLSFLATKIEESFAHVSIMAIVATFCCAAIGPGLFASTPFVTQSVAQYANPKYTACGGGSGVPGARLPFGMVNLSPDCGNGSANSGYDPSQPIYGFSHIHVSGTGGGAKYGNIPIMPTAGNLAVSNSSAFSAESVSCNYYKVNLNQYNITAELTVTEHAGFHKYTFPASSQSHILIDAGGGLLNGGFGENQSRVACGVTIVSDSVVKGSGTLKGGWNLGDPYTVYFYAVFSSPATSYGTWKGSAINSGKQSDTDTAGTDVGAFMNFTTTQGQAINVRVGISFISTDKAQANLAAEIASLNFQAVVDSGVSKWNKCLSSVLIEGASDAQTRGLYSVLYRSFIQPADHTGENPKWTSSEPYYDDYYAIWDTYRTLHPLITLTHENTQCGMVRSLIDIYAHDGYMPDARSGNCNGRTQGGSNAENVLADAYVKGLAGIDWTKGYAAMIKDATVPPANPRKEGRGGCTEYNSLGYVPSAIERAGTRTVEYSTDDWAIARVAVGLNKQDDYNTYKTRSGNWHNLWNTGVSSDGFSGFVMPKDASGAWQSFSPTQGGSWGDFFYEDPSWTYSLSVPQDVTRLISVCGGNAAFISRLDKFFSSYFDVGNEPGFMTPVFYLWAGSYQKMVDAMITHQRNQFDPSNCGGIPGNDDSGAMSSLFAWDELGLMPNAGWDYYIITSPVFSKVTIQMDNGNNFVITAQNVSATNKYVTAATLNGQTLNRAWVTHSEIKSGATLALTMGSSPSSWPSGPVPPDESTFQPVATKYSGSPMASKENLKTELIGKFLTIHFEKMQRFSAEILKTSGEIISRKSTTNGMVRVGLSKGVYIVKVSSGEEIVLRQVMAY
jgi:predicted alpha-1,2-mannosidase